MTHPFVQFINFDSDELRLLVPLQLVKSSLILDKLTEQERQQLFVILGLGKIFAEALPKHGCDQLTFVQGMKK